MGVCWAWIRVLVCVQMRLSHRQKCVLYIRLAIDVERDRVCTIQYVLLTFPHVFVFYLCVCCAEADLAAAAAE